MHREHTTTLPPYSEHTTRITATNNARKTGCNAGRSKASRYLTLRRHIEKMSGAKPFSTFWNSVHHTSPQKLQNHNQYFNSHLIRLALNDTQVQQSYCVWWWWGGGVCAVDDAGERPTHNLRAAELCWRQGRDGAARCPSPDGYRGPN